MIQETTGTKAPRHKGTEGINCRVCGNVCSFTDLTFEERMLVRCTQCGVMQVHPFPSEKEILSFYSHENFAREDGARFKEPAEEISAYFRKQRARTIHKITQSASLTPSSAPLPQVERMKILDIGAGRGVMLRELQKKGWDVYGTYPASSFQKHDEKSSIFYGDITGAHFPDAFFDCVTLFHVLEHLPDPRQTIQEIYRILKPGGDLIIEAPNSAGLVPRLFKAHWLGYYIPFHLTHFTTESLKKFLKQEGFAVERKKFFSLEQSPFVLFQSLLNVSLNDQNRFFNALMIQKKQPVSQGRKILYMAFIILLSPFCLLFSWLCGIFKKGDIMTFYCRKTEVIARV